MQDRLKIFYLQGAFPFCYYYRGYLPGVYSDQTVVSEFLRQDGDISNANLYEKAMKADVICFQRPSSKASLELGKLLKQKGKKIIMDNDDSYSGVPLHRLGNDKQREIAIEIRDNLDSFVKMADGVTVSTQILADEYSQLNPNTVVLKNCIDPLDEVPCKPNTTGKFRIGFIGSVTSNDDYVHIKDQIKRLDDRGDMTIVILGVKFQDGKIMPSMQEDYEFWSSLKNVEWHPVVHVTEYYMTVANLALDVAVIPRKDHYFNRCKSNLKFLDMSLLSIPVVAQGFSDGQSPYQGVDEQYMTVVVDDTQWYNSIVQVKEKHSDYKLLAQKAHDYVLREYNIIHYAKTWQDTIERLCTFQQNS